MEARPGWLSHRGFDFTASAFAYFMMALLVVALIWGLYYFFLHIFPS